MVEFRVWRGVLTPRAARNRAPSLIERRLVRETHRAWGCSPGSLDHRPPPPLLPAGSIPLKSRSVRCRASRARRRTPPGPTACSRMVRPPSPPCLSPSRPHYRPCSAPVHCPLRPACTASRELKSREIPSRTASLLLCHLLCNDSGNMLRHQRKRISWKLATRERPRFAHPEPDPNTHPKPDPNTHPKPEQNTASRN